MEQLGVVAGNFALSFSLIFLSIFVHISGSIRSILVKSDDLRSGREARLVTGATGINGLKCT